MVLNTISKIPNISNENPLLTHQQLLLLLLLTRGITRQLLSAVCRLLMKANRPTTWAAPPGLFDVRFHIMMSYGLPSPLASYYISLIPNR